MQIGNLIVEPLTRKLIKDAEEQLGRKEYGLAVVVAMTAAEVASAHAFDRAFQARGVGDLYEPTAGMLRGQVLLSNNGRKLYMALTKKEMTDVPWGKSQELWWGDYTAAVKLRNRVVHSGNPASEQEAREAINAARELVDYLVAER